VDKALKDLLALRLEEERRSVERIRRMMAAMPPEKRGAFVAFLTDRTCMGHGMGMRPGMQMRHGMGMRRGMGMGRGMGRGREMDRQGGNGTRSVGWPNQR
jgi:hypothetical protein